MLKKTFIFVAVCGFAFIVAGCTGDTTTLPLTSDESTAVSTLTRSSENSPTDVPSELTDNGSTASSTQNNTGEDNMNNDCKLIVKGKDITSGNYINLNYEKRYAEIPLTAVMKELGAKVEWQSNTTAEITFGGKDYALDTTKGTLIEDGGTFNILTAAPGSTHGIFYQVIGDEFIIDSDSAKMLIINMMGAKISIDYDNKIVSIE